MIELLNKYNNLDSSLLHPQCVCCKKKEKRITDYKVAYIISAFFNRLEKVNAGLWTLIKLNGHLGATGLPADMRHFSVIFGEEEQHPMGIRGKLMT